tara:strand:- start:1170 stop:1481 length:312 start_codon:yes stop_codon:yes gene_type:complete
VTKLITHSGRTVSSAITAGITFYVGPIHARDLFVSYAYYPDLMTPEERAEYARKWPEDATENPAASGGYDITLRERGQALLISDNAGDSWRLAVTKNFVQGLN